MFILGLWCWGNRVKLCHYVLWRYVWIDVLLKANNTTCIMAKRETFFDLENKFLCLAAFKNVITTVYIRRWPLASFGMYLFIFLESVWNNYFFCSSSMLLGNKLTIVDPWYVQNEEPPAVKAINFLRLRLDLSLKYCCEVMYSVTAKGRGSSEPGRTNTQLKNVGLPEY